MGLVLNLNSMAVESCAGVRTHDWRGEYATIVKVEGGGVRVTAVKGVEGESASDFLARVEADPSTFDPAQLGGTSLLEGRDDDWRQWAVDLDDTEDDVVVWRPRDNEALSVQVGPWPGGRKAWVNHDEMYWGETEEITPESDVPRTYAQIRALYEKVKAGAGG